MQGIALKYIAEIKDKSGLDLNVPVPPGACVTAFIVRETAERFEDLMLAAQSSRDLWDSPVDGKELNNGWSGTYCS